MMRWNCCFALRARKKCEEFSELFGLELVSVVIKLGFERLERKVWVLHVYKV